MFPVTLREKLLGQSGSFWSEQIARDQREYVRMLAGVGAASCCLDAAGAAASDAALPGRRFDSWKTFRFGEDDVRTLGMDPNSRIYLDWPEEGVAVIGRPDPRILKRIDVLADVDEAGADAVRHALEDSDGQVLLWPASTDTADYSGIPVSEFLQPTYALLADLPGRPAGLLSDSGRLLLAGIDFRFGFGALLFRTHPFELFPGGELRVASISEDASSLHKWSRGADFSPPGISRVRRLQRGASSLEALRLAALESAGCLVLDSDEFIRARIPLAGGGWLYMTEERFLEAPYDHDPLDTGTLYPAGTAVGCGIELLFRPSSDAVDWSEFGAALDLSDFLPFDASIPEGRRRVDLSEKIYAPVWKRCQLANPVPDKGVVESMPGQVEHVYEFVYGGDASADHVAVDVELRYDAVSAASALARTINENEEAAVARDNGDGSFSIRAATPAAGTPAAVQHAHDPNAGESACLCWWDDDDASLPNGEEIGPAPTFGLEGGEAARWEQFIADACRRKRFDASVLHSEDENVVRVIFDGIMKDAGIVALFRPMRLPLGMRRAIRRFLRKHAPVHSVLVFLEKLAGIEEPPAPAEPEPWPQGQYYAAPEPSDDAYTDPATDDYYAPQIS